MQFGKTLGIKFLSVQKNEHLPALQLLTCLTAVSSKWTAGILHSLRFLGLEIRLESGGLSSSSELQMLPFIPITVRLGVLPFKTEKLKFYSSIKVK